MDQDNDGVDFPWFVTGLGGKTLYSFGPELLETEYRYNSNYGSMIVTADQDSILFQFYSIVGGGTGTLMDSYLIDAPEPDDAVEPEDEAGNDADTKTRTVTVLEEDEGDTTPPVITMKGSSPVEVLVGASYVDAGAAATDDVDGNITSDIKTTSTVNTAVAGPYVVVYNVNDAAGNAASQVTRNVNVVAGSFDDTGSSVFADDIEWLADEGITEGCNPPMNTLFCPDDPVSRGQMSAFLKRALADVLSVDLPRAADFVDVDGSVFEGDVAWLSAADITRSCNPQDGGTKFCRTSNVARGQMAAFIRRAFEAAGL